MNAATPDTMTVNVWYARTPAPSEQAILDRLRLQLTPAERTQEQQYRLPELKAQFCLTRVLTRSVLAEITGCEAAALEFELGPHGKPALCRPVSRACAFNISHTRGAVLLAVAEQGNVGVDVERCDRRVNLDLADRYFAPREVEQLGLLEPVHRAQRFMKLWTLKEAFIKALGTGLATPLHSFAFDLSQDRQPGIETYQSAIGPPSRWLFRQFELDQQFLAAVAVLDAQVPAIDVHVHRWDVSDL